MISTRRKTHTVRIGNVLIGSEAPVAVQSMTNTDTADSVGTAAQVKELADAGSELVRITVNNDASAKAVPAIREALDKLNCHVPIVGDFHYNGHRLLATYPEMAKSLDKYRINPGNVGFGEKHDKQFAEIVEQAILHNKPVRIGVNWGSMDQALLSRLMEENATLAEPKPADEVGREALVVSAIESAHLAEAIGLAADRIILSAKVSKVQDLIAVYRSMAARCEYPLHLGLTEAGMGTKGIVSSTAALGVLLQEGIGDTIRVSLTPRPGEPRTEEVNVARQILQSLDIRSFTPQVTACPGCGRTTSTYFQELADSIQNFLSSSMPKWKTTYEGVETMNVAVMGCIVNGPGESKHANIGISLPGTGESPVAPVFEDGVRTAILRGDHIAEEFQQRVVDYIERTYRRKAA